MPVNYGPSLLVIPVHWVGWWNPGGRGKLYTAMAARQREAVFAGDGDTTTAPSNTLVSCRLCDSIAMAGS